MIKDYKEKHKNDMFKNGISARQAIIITLFGYLIYYILTSKPDFDDSDFAKNWMVSIFSLYDFTFSYVIFLYFCLCQRWDIL